MKTTEISNTSYSREQSLENLHRESQDWISEILFWQVELGFFQKLLKNASHLGSSEYDDRIVEGLYEKLVSFSHLITDDFQLNVGAHENYLDELLQSQPGRENAKYREKHREFLQQSQQLQAQFKGLKKEVFGLIEKLM